MVRKNIHLRGRSLNKLAPRISIGSYYQNSIASCCILLQKKERAHWAVNCTYSQARYVASRRGLARCNEQRIAVQHQRCYNTSIAGDTLRRLDAMS